MAANGHVFRGPTTPGMLDEAEAKGEAIGEARGVAKSLLKSLELRGISIDDEQRERIMTCTDENLLEEWFARAATAIAADEVFTD